MALQVGSRVSIRRGQRSGEGAAARAMHSRWLLVGHVLTVAVGGAYTLAVVALPHLGVVARDVSVRVAIEVGGFFLLSFAALILAAVRDDERQTARSAFVTGLVVMAVTNAMFGLALSLDVYRPSGGVAYYPWVVGRSLAGLLFALAAAGRLRLGVGRTLIAGLAVLAALDTAVIVFSERLVSVVRLVEAAGALPTVVVAAPGVHVGLQSVPGLLFLLAAWLAARSYRRSRSPLFFALSLALMVQSFTQLHEVLHPALLGPIITSADALRVWSFLLLAGGALLEARRLFVDQTATLHSQGHDLRAHDALAEELTRLVEREQDFQAIVSHELATPVAAIRAFAHVVAASVGDPLSVRVRQAIRGIRSESGRLSELVSRIDELRDLELTEFRCDPQPMLLRPLLTEAAAFVKGLPGDHAATVRGPENVRVWADPVRFGQAIRNVLGNAARYSPPETAITIEVEPASRGRIRIAVTDQGRGIPADERESVLGRYTRGRRTRGEEGVGLGLYVASRIAGAHGGRLRIEDPLDPGAAGTRVVIELRAAGLPENR